MVDTISDAPKIGGKQTFESVKVADVFGQTGRQGIQGEKGEAGAVYFPILKDGVLSWVNNGGLPNPDPIDVKTIISIGARGIKGDRGEKGEQGKQGKAGVRGLKGDAGKDGNDGLNGKDGKDGKDGATFRPVYDEKTCFLSWTNDKGLPNPEPILIKGKDGKDGKNGKHGLGGANAVINGYSTLEIMAGDGIKIKQKNNKMLISSDGNWADKSALDAHTQDDENPHETTAAQVGAYTQEQVNTALGNKVDKVAGKGLSTNDYTNEDKARLADTSGENTGDQDLSGLLPKSGGAMTGVLTYASPQVLNMQPVDAEPDAVDMVEGCIYFVAEDV